MCGWRSCVLLLRDIWWSVHWHLMGRIPLECSVLEELDLRGEEHTGLGVAPCHSKAEWEIHKVQSANRTQLQSVGHHDITSSFHMLPVPPQPNRWTFSIPCGNTQHTVLAGLIQSILLSSFCGIQLFQNPPDLLPRAYSTGQKSLNINVEISTATSISMQLYVLSFTLFPYTHEPFTPIVTPKTCSFFASRPITA